MTKFGNVFITGANRGIGLGLVKEFAKQSDVQNIFAGCRDPNKAKELSDLQAAHPSIKIIQIDVQNDSTIKSAVTEVERILGPNSGLNVLINNAAILEKNSGQKLAEPDRKVWLQHFDVNTVSVAIVTAAFLPLLRKASAGDSPSKVVNISSTLGSTKLFPSFPKLFGLPDNIRGTKALAQHENIVYGMSKAALNHYTRALACDEPTLIAIAVCPGWVRTDMGGSDAMISVEDSTSALLNLIASLSQDQSGGYFSNQGNQQTFAPLEF
ncbi:short chain dehydrogenase domain-containing protein [Ditylenchus destructor]|uniref:Short chain dehydrogenase domain-containing protein n=1 Tax=Ditylenchus destructor TaxID=166010 RepID=A0AAD4QW88_9BILA|nr:short chain dehydrogenase domain-containing protein [Ditylenchus destructor]